MKSWSKAFLIGFVGACTVIILGSFFQTTYLENLILNPILPLCEPVINNSIFNTPVCAYFVSLLPFIYGLIAASAGLILFRIMQLLWSQTIGRLSKKQRYFGIATLSLIYSYSEMGKQQFYNHYPFDLHLTLWLSLPVLFVMGFFFFFPKIPKSLNFIKKFETSKKQWLTGIRLGAVFGLAIGIYAFTISTVYGWHILTTPGNLNENLIISGYTIINYAFQALLLVVICSIFGLIIGLLHRPRPLLAQLATAIIIGIVFYFISLAIFDAVDSAGAVVSTDGLIEIYRFFNLH